MFASTSQPTVTASLVQFIFQWISYSFEFGIIVFGYWFRYVGISSCAPLELVLFGLAYIVIKYFALYVLASALSPGFRTTALVEEYVFTDFLTTSQGWFLVVLSYLACHMF